MNTYYVSIYDYVNDRSFIKTISARSFNEASDKLMQWAFDNYEDIDEPLDYIQFVNDAKRTKVLNIGELEIID